MLDPKGLRTADLISGSLVALLGIGVLVGASQMPIGGTYGGVENPWYASPAAVPLLLGSLLVLAGLGVVFQGWRAGAARDFRSTVFSWFGGVAGRRRVLWIAGIWGGLLLYVLVLSWKPFGGLAIQMTRWIRSGAPLDFLIDPGGINYWLASSVFLTAAVLLTRPQRKSRAWLRDLLMIVGLWVGVLVLAFLFSKPLQVPLP